jgi:hypothetical protein
VTPELEALALALMEKLAETIVVAGANRHEPETRAVALERAVQVFASLLRGRGFGTEEVARTMLRVGYQTLENIIGTAELAKLARARAAEDLAVLETGRAN